MDVGAELLNISEKKVEGNDSTLVGLRNAVNILAMVLKQIKARM